MSGTDDIGQDRRALTPRPGYEVGYGKPPRHSQFKPGQSGNPKGRPKGAKNKRPALHEERMKDIILDEAYRCVPIRDGDKTVTIPLAQAVMRSISVNAAKGNARAQRLFAQLLADTESSRKLLHDEFFEKALTYKIEWDRELERRRQMGITHLPEPLPHPDHIVLDMQEGTVRITGPMTREEKAELDKWRDRLEDIKVTTDDLRDQLQTEDDPKERAEILRHIDMGEKLHQQIAKALG